MYQFFVTRCQCNLNLYNCCNFPAKATMGRKWPLL